MPATLFSLNNRLQFTRWYVGLFYGLALYKLFNGMWLFQVQPHFFNTRFDFFTWVFMQTGLHQWLLNNPAGWALFDGLFYSLPLLYWLAFKKSIRRAAIVAGIMLVVNWLYVQCYTLYPTNSIEGHVGWLLFPFLLMSTRLPAFWLLMHGMRYFFLYLFVSAALWKFYQGGIFNPLQMSGVLLQQHKEFLVAAPEHGYSQFIYGLIRHPLLGYSLYVLAAITELLFAIGFFTKKFDRLLLILFLLFLLSDFVVMRIPYFEWLPLALPLFFSKYGMPVNENQLLKQVNTKTDTIKNSRLL